jgi:hypothetical protein
VYCPPLDDATFYAIALDYDLPADVNSLTAILDDLSAAAVTQENSNFDPSGTGGSPSTNVPRSSCSQTTPEDTSTSNEITSAATGLIDLPLEDLGCVEKSLQDLPVEGQRKWLKNLFPSLREEHISNVLSDSISLEQAVDALLNFAFLEASGSADESSGRPVPKGIDGFAEEVRPQQRKGRTKRQHRTNDSSRASSAGSFASDTLGSSNVWSSAAEDVEFICSRTNLQPHTVRSVYHTQGARLPPTIRALADKEGAAWARLEKVESMVQMQVAEVKIDYDFVPDAQVYGLLTLARNIPSAARELLEAMAASSESGSAEKIFAQYAAPDLTPRNQLPESTNAESWSIVSNGNTRQYATVHGAAASQAFSQASAAYRKSKSDRLMGGAAAYYASVGHENLKVAKSLQAAAANSHVAAQSSSTVLDLHGVSVADATRIAGDRTRSWWDGLGDAKYASGGGGPGRSGFKIVTGIGSHSKNHAPRIGPAVTKMLVREGWRVEVGHGELVVTGKSRR